LAMQAPYPSNKQPHSSSDKGARRRMRLLMMIVLCFVVWAGLTSVNQAEFVRSKKAQLSILEDKLALTKANNEKLKLEITRLNDSEYIEQIAKKDHQMIFPGETLFTEPDSPEE